MNLVALFVFNEKLNNVLTDYDFLDANVQLIMAR